MMTLCGQIIVRDNVLRRILAASINNVMTLSAYHTCIITCTSMYVNLIIL